MPNNRQKPTQLKILQGNPGKRPLNKDEPLPERGIPTMPKWLKPFKEAVREWKRESKILDDMGLMTIADAGSLALRSYISHQIQELAKEINDEGTTIELKAVNKEGEEIVTAVKSNPKAVQLKNLLSEYRQLGTLLGLDPSGRAKLKAEKPQQKSKAQQFRDRKKG